MAVTTARAHKAHANTIEEFRSFQPPPAGFDPQTASARALAVHGFPRRPDPAKEPALAALWQRAFQRAPKLHMTKADLALDPIMTARDPMKHLNKDFSPSGWASITVTPASLGYNQPANTVFAEWVVPTIFPVAGDPSTALTVGFWVGLDGSDPNSYELLQAGTAATITGNNVNYWVWTEWFTSEYKTPAVQVTNFAIQPGDLVSCLVCAPLQGQTQGSASFLNYRTQQATTVGIPAPGSDITSVGTRAIWAVEGISADLPDFSPQVFSSISAGTQSHAFNLSPDGVLSNITGNNNATLAQAFIASPTVGLVLWEGSA
jgi:Peptidase A4 family